MWFTQRWPSTMITFLYALHHRYVTSLPSPPSPAGSVESPMRAIFPVVDLEPLCRDAQQGTMYVGAYMRHHMHVWDVIRMCNVNIYVYLGMMYTCIYAWVCIYIHIYTRIQKYTHIYIYMCMYAYMYIYIHIHIFSYIYIYEYICTHTHTCKHLYIYIRTQTPIYMYVYIYIYVYVNVECLTRY